jgi:type I restriction-modification system DNA methylase subunit
MAKATKTNHGTAANVRYEIELWPMADALRGSMDAAEYKHVVLGLIFLKYISDAFEAQHAELEAEKDQGADPEDPDEYRALNMFWVPSEARWSHLKAQAKQSTNDQLVDEAMAGIERDNPSLKGVLPKDYARPTLDKESNYTTWWLARMNLAIRGIDGQIAHGDSFHNDCFPDLKADYILANPSFNVSDWRGDLLMMDKRWQYGVPPAGNANFAWVQHIVHHLAPMGLAGFALANGSMSSNQAGEGEIRKNIIEADLVDCMVALPGQLFYSTQIPACLWFLARDKSGKSPSPSLGQGSGGSGRFRDRRGQVLFIDARRLGRIVDRTHRGLIDEEIARIARTYHAWRGTLSSPLPPGEAGGEGTGTFEYQDIPGFCKSAMLEDIRKHGYVLTPSRYVGAEAQADDSKSFGEKMRRLTAQLREQQTEARRLDEAIWKNLKEQGYDA